MTRIFNRKLLQIKRRQLRNNQTDVEKFLWDRLRNKQFYGLRFLRQFSVESYILDFYCPMRKLAIELDGGQHNDENKVYYDKHRSEILSRYGITVLRFWNNDVFNNIDGVMTEIYNYI